MSDSVFLSWCQQNGITIHGVEPGYVAAGWRGIIATEAILPGSVVMSVPEKLLMSVMSARRDPQLAAVLQSYQLNSHQVLSIHLLFEASKGSSSMWNPYIRQLPLAFSTFMCWPAEAVRALQLPHAQAAAAAAADKSRREWSEARRVLQLLGLAKKWCSLGAWHWASSCVLSRTMYHPDDAPCGCLTPLADLHNHAPPPPPYTPDLVDGVQQLLDRGAQLGAPLQQAGAACGAVAAAVDAGREGATATATDRGAVGHSHTSCAAAANGAAANGAAADGAADADAADANCSRPSPNTDCAGLHGNGNSAAVLNTTATAVAAPEASGGQIPSAVVDDSGPSNFWGDGYYDAATKAYNIVARYKYSAGDQVFLCYGRHTNLDLLDLYAFLLPDNPHDEAHVPVEVMQQALHEELQRRQQQQQTERQWRRQHHQHKQQQQQQQSMVGSVLLDVTAAGCYIHITGQPSWQLLKALRLAAATLIELRGQSHLAFSGEAISVASERTAVLALMRACTLQLQQLPTALEEDEALMGSMKTTAGVMTTSAPSVTSTDSDLNAAASSAATSATGTSAAQAAMGTAMCRLKHHSGAAELPVNASSAAAGTGQRAGSAAKIYSTTVVNSKHQQQHQPCSATVEADRQQQECMLLSLQWRACYKRALAECVKHCRKAADMLDSN